MGAYPLLQADPRSRDLVLFHEYFHGDNGRGVGASHQTGWSGLVALLLQPRAACGARAMCRWRANRSGRRFP